MPVASDLDLCNFIKNIENLAAEKVPNLTVFGQRFAEISRNECHCAVLGPPSIGL